MTGWARDWEAMSSGERRFHIAGLVLVAICLALVVGTIAFDRLGDYDHAFAILWWLLVAAQACRVAVALLGKRRKAPGAFRADVIVSSLIVAVFAFIALRASGIL